MGALMGYLEQHHTDIIEGYYTGTEQHTIPPQVNAIQAGTEYADNIKTTPPPNTVLTRQPIVRNYIEPRHPKDNNTLLDEATRGMDVEVKNNINNAWFKLPLHDEYMNLLSQTINQTVQLEDFKKFATAENERLGKLQEDLKKEVQFTTAIMTAGEPLDQVRDEYTKLISETQYRRGQLVQLQNMYDKEKQGIAEAFTKEYNNAEELPKIAERIAQNKIKLDDIKNLQIELAERERQTRSLKELGDLVAAQAAALENTNNAQGPLNSARTLEDIVAIQNKIHEMERQKEVLEQTSAEMKRQKSIMKTVFDQYGEKELLESAKELHKTGKWWPFWNKLRALVHEEEPYNQAYLQYDPDTDMVFQGADYETKRSEEYKKDRHSASSSIVEEELQLRKQRDEIARISRVNAYMDKFKIGEPFATPVIKRPNGVVDDITDMIADLTL